MVLADSAVCDELLRGDNEGLRGVEAVEGENMYADTLTAGNDNSQSVKQIQGSNTGNLR